MKFLHVPGHSSRNWPDSIRKAEEAIGRSAIYPEVPGYYRVEASDLLAVFSVKGSGAEADKLQERICSLTKRLSKRRYN